MKQMIAPLLLLAACSQQTPPQMPPISPISVATGDECGAASYEGLAGRPDTDLERILILGQVRIIRPGRPYTDDLRPQRLNFQIGADGRIERVFCG